MKNIIGKLSIGALLFCAAACSGDDLPVYEDVNRIYFSWATAGPSSDMVHFSFGYEIPMKPDSIINVGVRVMGRLSDQDRPIKAEVIWAESTIAPEDIEFLPSVVPAGSRNGTLRVKLKNSDKLLTKTLWAKIRLTPNEYFHVDRNAFPVGGSTYAGLEYNIEFDAKGDIPNMWLDGSWFRNYFGAHSKVKEQWIYYMTGYTRADFTYDIEAVRATMAEKNQTLQKTVSDLEVALLPGEYAYGILSRLGRWLEAYENGTTKWPAEDPSKWPNALPGTKDPGIPLLDENGNPVEVTGSAAGTFN
ncbi:MAG: DUF4843 domain-containing protein [Culturomica sp.]|jgi:hypothetical protein|nr:DUF4843 domain-containing protein [Culturomica sp.]